MRVWLDDERLPPDGWTWVKTASEAIDLLKTNTVEKISLDHDLGDTSNGTGYDVAVWIEQAAYQGTLTQLRVRIHSQNPIGRQKMALALQNAVRYWEK